MNEVDPWILHAFSMGGLFTVVKVRDQLRSYDEDPGWYQHPLGAVAMKASDAELGRDGISVGNNQAAGTEDGTHGGSRNVPGLVQVGNLKFAFATSLRCRVECRCVFSSGASGVFGWISREPNLIFFPALRK